MIDSRRTYYQYLRSDFIARYGKTKVPLSILFKTRKLFLWNIYLRRAELHINSDHKLRALVYKNLLLSLGCKLGWSVEPNCFGPGLCIVHYGTVVVSPYARIGSNARVHVDVVVGASGGKHVAPYIGDNVYFGPGCKIYGKVLLGDNVVIGANSVVNKSFEENNILLVGVPAEIKHRNIETRNV